MIFRLLFLDGAVVIPENESAIIVRIGGPSGSLVAGAEITTRIVLGQCRLGRFLLLPSESLLPPCSRAKTSLTR